MRTMRADSDRVSRIEGRARDTQTIRGISGDTACKGVQALAPLAPGRKYGTRRSLLSEYMSLHLFLKLTTNCGPLFENKMREIYFYKEKCFVSFIEFRKTCMRVYNISSILNLFSPKIYSIFVWTYFWFCPKYCVHFVFRNFISSSSSCRAASTDIPDLSCHFSLSFIASGRSSGLHPVSSQSCCIYVRAGRPAFARPYMGGGTTWILIFSRYKPD